MKTISFCDGEQIAGLGQGTWKMGEHRNAHSDELAALRLGIELGMSLIDTAEMYGNGAAEELVGEALKGQRNKAFIVTKAYPENTSLQRLPRACEASLRRLRTDRIDLYLLHWRGNVPLAETVEAMERLVAAGKIRRWGVSNLDRADMEDLFAAGGSACASNQILYNLTRRGPEYDLLPWLEAHSIAPMAYSPVEQGRILADATLARIAAERGATPAQIALAFVLHRQSMIAIPKAATLAHVRDNAGAAEITLTDEELALLDTSFPAPLQSVPLAML